MRKALVTWDDWRTRFTETITKLRTVSRGKGADGQNTTDPGDYSCWAERVGRSDRKVLQEQSEDGMNGGPTDGLGASLGPVLMCGVDWRAAAHGPKERLMMFGQRPLRVCG